MYTIKSEDLLKTDLWGHQKDAVTRSLYVDNFALFFEMGTGKTLTTIAIILDKYKRAKRPLRTLIFCPLVVVPNWRREFLSHSDIPQCLVSTLEGSQKKRIKTLSKKASPIYISNYESLGMGDLFELYKQFSPEILVFDESHKLKTHNAVRTKKATILADKCPHKILLSGTPVLNSPMDLFSQYRVLDGGDSFGKNFYGFRARYFYDANAGMPTTIHFPVWKVKPNAISEINHIVNNTALRITKEECLDLPPMVREVQYVDMTPEQAKMYKQMKQDFIAFLNDKACVAQLALTKALRLQQIISGFVKLEDGTEVTLPSTPREKALEELLEQLTPNHKVIVWAVFKHNFKQISASCEKLKIDYVQVHGEISGKAKQENIDRFTNDDRCRVFIGHPGAGGIGINLTVSSYSIFFSRGFSLEHDLQAEARNHRGGSERHSKVTRIDLVCKETIDELVLEMLAKKVQLGEDLLQAIRQGDLAI